MDRVLLAVYGIKIYRRQDIQMAGGFGNNNSLDLLKLFHEFVEDVLRNVRNPVSGKHTHIFTCVDYMLPVLDEDQREAHGFFHCGRDGDSYMVGKYDKDGNPTSKTRVTRDMHSMRDSFYYLKVPKGVGKKRAYLVLQRAEGQGIKDMVIRLFQKYLDDRGLKEYRVITLNLVPEKVFTNMMEHGRFKQLTLIKHGIPAAIEQLRNQEERVPIEDGTVKTIYQANNLGSSWKEWALRKFNATRESKQTNHNSRVVVELAGQSGEYDEVSMLVELDGKEKTFHLSNSSRTQPDMDVSKKVETDTQGRLRVDHLLDQSRELVADVTLEITPEDGIAS